MGKYTIELKKEEIHLAKVIQAVNEFTKIEEAIAFIIKDYADTKSYSQFIKSHQKKKK